MLFERTFEEILSEATENVTSQSRIKNVSSGSFARALLESYSRHTNEAYQIFDLNLARSFVSAANGKFLDYIGQLVGLTRLGTAAALASSESKSVKFTVDVGNFGDINGASSITIPAGTIISTEDVTGGAGINYRTTLSTVLSAIISEQFVAVEAILPGSSQNIGAGVLQFHNFVNYTDFLNDTLKVSNPNGVFTGQDVESDTNFRFRITRQVTAAEAGNITSIRLAALSVPGVADIVFAPYARGIGTWDVLIKSITPTVSQSLIDAVQASVDIVSSQGTNGLSRRPIETGMTFTITIVYVDTLTTDVKNDIEDSVRTSLANYVNSIDIGNDFVINEAIQRVLEVDERIKDIGVPTKPFDDITLHIESQLQDNKIQQTLLKNYPTADDERVIIEPSSSEPITIIRAN